MDFRSQGVFQRLIRFWIVGNICFESLLKKISNSYVFAKLLEKYP